MRIVDAKFETSAQGIDDSLYEGVNEVAMLGRSNVGKSSFINAITNHKNLAKKSQTPGKTRLINFFTLNFIDDDGVKTMARVVDLPGFGYAKVSKSEQSIWSKNLTDYLENRVSIRVFVHLRDARHPSMKIDVEVAEYLKTIKRRDQEIIEIFTKADKIKQKERSALFKAHPKALLVSNTSRSNINKAIDLIYGTIFE